MLLPGDNTKPIYMQIAEGIEDEILKGNMEEEEQVLSTNQFAKMYNINPATAGKGINLLVEEGILYKKRGLGMFVATGALVYIQEKRKKKFFNDYVLEMILEGKKLGISRGEIIRMIEEMEG